MRTDQFLRGVPQKSSLFSGPATKGEGGGKAWPLRKNYFFLKLEKKSGKICVATKLEGGKGALVAGPLKKDRFFAASLRRKDTY